LVPRRADVSGVSGWTALAAWVLVSKLRLRGCWRTGTGLRMCADCGLKTSATADTIFHRSHTPLSDEFTFRFNRRTSRARGLLFYRLLQQAAGTDPHPLSELIGGTGNDWDEVTND
jgi:hypothetical protein